MKSLTLLRQDIDLWNQWRAIHPGMPCRLTAIDLSRGYFFEGNFSSLDLSNTDFRRACLIGANFRYANLTGADLSEAYLVDADFTGANLHEAKLAGAHVERANFAKATGLSTEQWETVAKARELTAVLSNTLSKGTESKGTEPRDTESKDTGNVGVLQKPKSKAGSNPAKRTVESQQEGKKWRRSVRGRNVYDPGISRAIARLGLGPVAHEKKLMRMLAASPFSAQK